MTATLLVLAVLTPLKAAPPERRVLMPFDYHGVRVTDGILRRQLDDAKAYYLQIPNDDLLLGFRKRAGFPAPGKELGGWYSSDTFHVFGQILSGLARMYRATGDLDCKAKADALLDGWTKCIRSDGWFYFSDKPNAPHYTYDKMVGGLVDMAIYCGRKDAFKSLAKITDWAEKNLDRTNEYAHNAGEGSTEWYTLSENLYRAYLATGDERYKRFAKVWEYTDYWGLYARKQNIFSKRPDGGQTGRYHAYSHVNALGGAGLAYRLTGASHYLDTLKNAYAYLQANECFATGGFGPDESLLPKASVVDRLKNTSSTFETQCGTWAVFKLCKHLVSLTGDARYGDWAEQVAYNGIAATPPMSPEGRVFYYSDYNPHGGVKRNIDEGWTCCTGTRPMAIADVCDLIYFKAKDGLCVNLFVPSQAEFDEGGAHVSLTQTTRFPEEGKTSLQLHLTKPARFSLRVREPNWLSAAPSMRINGKAATPKSDAKHWLVIDRTWKDGDRVEVRLPMTLRATPLQQGKTYPTAITEGPVVLAFRSAKGSSIKDVNLQNLRSDFVSSPGEPLTYHLRSNSFVLVKPFYDFKLGEEYFLYLDPGAIGRVPHHRLRTSGFWHDGGDRYWGNEVGAWCEGDFEGDAVRVLGLKFDDAGIGEVRVDGKVVGKIDQYAAGRDLPGGWDFRGFGQGKHVIRITVTADKSPHSKDRYLNISGLQVQDQG